MTPSRLTLEIVNSDRAVDRDFQVVRSKAVASGVWVPAVWLRRRSKPALNNTHEKRRAWRTGSLDGSAY
jgi:hypothetical protein